MSDFESELRQDDERLIELASIGVNVELLAKLEPEDARIVVSGMAKALNIRLRSGEATKVTTIEGLPEVGDLNRIASEFTALDNEAIKKVLEKSSMVTSLMLQEKDSEIERQRAVNEQIAGVFMDSIMSPETLANQLTGHLKVDGLNIGQKLTSNILDIELIGGVVAKASVIEPKKNLYINLDTDTRVSLELLRSDVDEDELRVFVNDNGTVFVNDINATTFTEQSTIADINGLAPGWYDLVNAVSKNDKSKKTLAARLFTKEHGKDYYDEDSLVGTRLLGSYDTEREQKNYAYMQLEVTASMIGDGSDDTINVVKLSSKDAVELAGQASILPRIEDLYNSENGTVFYKDNQIYMSGPVQQLYR